MSQGTTGDSDAPGIAGSGSPTETVRAAVVPRLGGKLGRYELMEVMGHGAMATVFRARDTQLGREVAVKVMSLAVAARAESAERFRREAQAVATVKHPGIVEIFDFVGASAGEPAYIVSELISGPTLRQFLDSRRGRLLPESAALIAIPIAEALQVAHARGIVHRDIKPDNVMLDRSGGKCRVVVTDFGVAHITGLETMTATGALVGSPAFMSPEQARGHDVGPASDLWALGVLIYEMATGHLPFPGKDALLVVASIARGLYRRPSLVSPYAGPGLDEICGRCLRTQPTDRYPQLDLLANDLRAFCRTGGLEPDERSRFDLLTDPERFEASLRPRVADAAVVQARRHSRRGELARALGELARATAYVPRHAEAEKLVASISWRRRWLKVSGVVAVAAGLVAAAVYLGPRARDWWSRLREVPPAMEVHDPSVTPGGPAAKTAAAEKAAVEERGAPAAGTGAEMAAVATAGRPAAGGKNQVRLRNRGKSVNRRGKQAKAESASAAAPAGDADAGGPENAGESTPAIATPEPAPVEIAPPPPRRVAVVIYAGGFFCDPSLDEHPPSVSPAVYQDANAVPEGDHDVYCTMPGGRKVWVAKVPIAPPPRGGAVRISLAKGEQGKPIIVPVGTTRVRQRDPGPAKNPGENPPQPR
jgi:tRNA A-37 threonylcarbamoyl transferase component Bud32